jgi:DNA-binding IclR family transcriptional regulator
MPQLESLMARARSEYFEMPGLRLTLAQACRLWQVDVSTCEMLLDRLVRAGFLRKTDKGYYIAAAAARTTPL